MREYIEIGKIVNTHGVVGALKVEPWCDGVDVLCSMKKVYFCNKEVYRAVGVISATPHKGHALMKLEGIDTLEKAITYKTCIIYVKREDIPLEEGAFLIDDLIGLKVTDVNTGVIYGTLSDVIQGAAGDIYEIKTEKGNVLIPAVKEFVKKIDLKDGIFLAPIGGMFDEV